IKLIGPNSNDVAEPGVQPLIDSRFRLIIVAGLRTKQLLHGSQPRIETDPLRRRNTSIALEEVRRGLVPFTKSMLKVSDPGFERPLTAKSQASIDQRLPNILISGRL
ncbi:MAG: DNA-directed RNA polymerase subunit omega, partial [Pyrinomonadaceae bacterium]